MHKLPKLPYQYNALVPFIDEQTMKIHHDLHHGGYVQKLNIALEQHPELQDKELKKMLQEIDSLPQEIKQSVINNGGGHWNHSFFWESLTPEKNQEPLSALKDAINKQFNSFDNFKKEFNKKALTLFGSGWTWLIKNGDKLEILQTNNQNCPLSLGMAPILTLDVWEHAYYLQYQNRRAEYIEQYWNFINWQKAEELFLS